MTTTSSSGPSAPSLAARRIDGRVGRRPLPTDLPLRSAHVAGALNAEWVRLRLDDTVGERITTWPGPVGGDGVTLAEVLAACGGDRSLDVDAADANLAVLVGVAHHDEVAARVVLQRIVPGLVQAARRRRHLGMQHAFDELVATAWVVIRTYPLARRPRRIAANLCRDAEYHAFVRPRRLRSADERPLGTLHDERAQHPRQDGRPGARRPSARVAGAGVMRVDLPAAADEVRALLAEAAMAGVDPVGLALVVDMHLAGRHPGVLASELNVSERTVRNRRDAVVRQLAWLAE